MQGNRLLLAVIGGLTALSISTPTLALEMSAPEGWYLEGNVGVSRISNVSYVKNNSGAAYNFNLGYKFMPYAALEAGYASYRNATIEVGSTKVGDLAVYSYDIAAKGIVPISNSGVDIFAKLGVAHLRSNAATSTAFNNVSASGNATNVFLGVGGQFNIMQELGIVLQWQRAQGSNNTGTEDLFSVGLAFIFV